MSDSSHAPLSAPTSAPLHGMLAEFDNVTDLTAACQKVRDAGFVSWDAHTPFPVHGLDQAMGVRPTKLPWLVLGAGLTGLSCALTLQWFCNTYDYPFLISGKPLFSLPAFIPVCFEMTVLFSAITAMFGSLILNKLPELFNPLFKVPRFRRATADRFFVYIERKDPRFEQAATEALLRSCQPLALESVYHDVRSPDARLPRGLPGAIAVGIALTLLPLALIARARESTMEDPRIHIIPDDMDNQYKFKPQASNWFFEDGRAARPPVAGTVAAEDIETPDTYFTGRAHAQATGAGPAPDAAATAAAIELNWSRELPPQVAVDAASMARGHERFGVYCAPCHGLAGLGDGLVSRHADRLAEGTWVTPSSLHDARVRDLPVGDIYNTITHGVRNMPGYGEQIPVADRWAIVLYVRALQMSQHAPASAVPHDILPTVK